MKAMTLSMTALAVLTSSPALAAGGHGFSFAIEGFYIIDFVLFVGLIWFFVKGPARKFLVNRYERVKAELEAATKLRMEAEARLADLERMVSSVETEIAGIRDQFKADGEREQARILAEAEVNADKIRANATKQLEQEMAKLREQLETELVRSVLESTEAKVRQKLDQSAQKKLASTYVDQLEKLDKLDRAA